MTTSDITNIVVTVAIVQLCCDLAANHFVFAQDAYQRAVGRLSREQFKLKKLQDQDKEGKVVTEKQQKKFQKAKADVAEASAEITKRHTAPSFFTSVVFFLLYRILATEYFGKVVAVLPFAPWSLIRKLSMRGLEIDLDKFQPGADITSPNQACSFLFIYVLSSLSVKFVVSKVVGTKPPKGAEGGIMSILDAPQSQKMLKNWGIDNESIYMKD